MTAAVVLLTCATPVRADPPKHPTPVLDDLRGYYHWHEKDRTRRALLDELRHNGETWSGVEPEMVWGTCWWDRYDYKVNVYWDTPDTPLTVRFVFVEAHTEESEQRFEWTRAVEPGDFNSQGFAKAVFPLSWAHPIEDPGGQAVLTITLEDGEGAVLDSLRVGVYVSCKE